MTRFLIILLFSFLSLTAIADRRVCEDFDRDTVVTEYACPAGYREIGTVNNGGYQGGRLKLSDSLFQSIRDFGRETEAQRKEREEKARRLGESIVNNLNEIAEARKERARIKAWLEGFFPDLNQLIKSRQFKKWVRASKDRKKLLRELKNWDESSLEAMLKLIPEFKIKEMKLLYNGVPSVSTDKYDYFGAILKGEKVGMGAFVFRSGTQTQCFGEFSKNNINGVGGCFWAGSGSAYLGKLKKGVKSGEGASYFGDTGAIHIGSYLKGKSDGKGVYAGSNGNGYDGYYRNGLREGSGAYIYASGTRYVGGWKANKRHGSGSIIRTDGWTNIVQYDMGLRHGKVQYLDGDKMVMIAAYEKGKCQSVRFLISQDNAGVAAKLNCKEQLPVASLR